MDVIRMPVSKLNPQQIKDLANDLLAGLTASPDFPGAPLMDLTTHTTDLATRLTAVTDAQAVLATALAARDAVADTVRNDLTTIANWAEGVTTDPVKLTNARFQLRATPQPVTMVQITNLAATPGDGEGKVDWMCDPQPNAIYLIETSPDLTPRVWSKQDPSKKSSGTITGLPSLTRVWVRVAAKGSNNTGGWSDPALIAVP
jgi:hypothetical protein